MSKETKETKESKEKETEEENEYISSLSPLEKKTLEIAQSHLESSFNLQKSIGFMKWKEVQNALIK
tara:strand:- start:394 stop:591 length:198 start_codon:yes stop_codon:yes gene_type:complete